MYAVGARQSGDHQHAITAIALSNVLLRALRSTTCFGCSVCGGGGRRPGRRDPKKNNVYTQWGDWYIL